MYLLSQSVACSFIHFCRDDFEMIQKFTFFLQPEDTGSVGHVVEQGSGTLGRSSGTTAVAAAASSSSSGGGMDNMMSEMQKKLAARRAKAENTGQVKQMHV